MISVCSRGPGSEKKFLTSCGVCNSLKTMHLYCCNILNLEIFFYSTGHRTAYNWLTGSSMDTLAEYTLGSESVSSLLVFDKKDGRGIRAKRPVGEGFGTKHLTATSDEIKGHNG